MTIGKVLLYYCFTPIEDPTAIMLWQRTLCESLGLKGRILISEHGINGTVGGDMEACKRYVRQTKEYPGFKRMQFKWSEGGADDFPRLSVKVRDEIVAFGAPGELKVDENGPVGGAVYLPPLTGINAGRRGFLSFWFPVVSSRFQPFPVAYVVKMSSKCRHVFAAKHAVKTTYTSNFPYT